MKMLFLNSCIENRDDKLISFKITFFTGPATIRSRAGW
jgi:hypothetical protein